ncbi:MAG: HAD-IA family hydrolase [Proteobacteria bacterium]|nr:HAD-IA family hydrolase [Pseudomonadota bacterium]MDA1180776.1 HAD-IA family hydrolase [Pseudomonadota bacterium]
MTYKSLLFGSIGTIIETSELQRESFNEAFKEAGLDWYWDHEDYRLLLKQSGGTKRIEDFAEKNNTTVEAQKIRERKTHIFNKKLMTEKLMPREGVIDVIEYAKNNQIKLGFVTSTTKENVNSVFLALKNYFIEEDFDFVGNNMMVQNPKPHSDIYIEAIKRLNLEPNECIAIEDSRESALSAHNAKVSCIAFPGLFHEEDNFDFCSKIILKLDTSIFN